MTEFRLGINNCFAVKRWPEPERWAAVIRDRVGVDLVQHTLDLVDLNVPASHRARQAERVRAACADAGLTLHSTFTGLAAYSANLLLDPDSDQRDVAERWFVLAIDFSARAGALGTGGHVGAYGVADWRDRGRRLALERELIARLHALAGTARRAGLDVLYIENLASAREPSTMDQVARLLTVGDHGHVPVRLCLDVGHMCVPGTRGKERDPYAWLRRFGPDAPAVHLQQSDAAADHHWPFTAANNGRGRIDAARVLASLVASGARSVDLILEVIPPFEADDEKVIAELAQSVRYWKRALRRMTA